MYAVSHVYTAYIKLCYSSIELFTDGWALFKTRALKILEMWLRLVKAYN